MRVSTLMLVWDTGTTDVFKGVKSAMKSAAEAVSEAHNG